MTNEVMGDIFTPNDADDELIDDATSSTVK